MSSRAVAPLRRPNVTIRVSGQLFKGHLPYLQQLVESAADCRLWPVLHLARLQEIDRDALFYLLNGENHDFGVESCPVFVREWMDRERDQAA